MLPWRSATERSIWAHNPLMFQRAHLFVLTHNAYESRKLNPMLISTDTTLDHSQIAWLSGLPLFPEEKRIRPKALRCALLWTTTGGLLSPVFGSHLFGAPAFSRMFHVEAVPGVQM